MGIRVCRTGTSVEDPGPHKSTEPTTDTEGVVDRNVSGKHFAVWRNGRMAGVTATTHQRLARLLYLLTAEPRAVCEAAARIGWMGRSVRLQAEGDVLVVTPWTRR